VGGRGGGERARVVKRDCGFSVKGGCVERREVRDWWVWKGMFCGDHLSSRHMEEGETRCRIWWEEKGGTVGSSLGRIDRYYAGAKKKRKKDRWKNSRREEGIGMTDARKLDKIACFRERGKRLQAAEEEEERESSFPIPREKLVSPKSGGKKNKGKRKEKSFAPKGERGKNNPSH